MQMYYYCDVIACLIQGCRIMHTVTWLFLGYGFLTIVIRNTENYLLQTESVKVVHLLPYTVS